MELVEFYRALLPAHGHYCLWFKGTKQHFWVDDLDKLAAATTRTHAKPDWYFATAAFDGAKSRKQDHVLSKRCFYLDLDAGAEKFAKHPEDTYETNEAAQLALRDFVRATKLVPSIVVHSGAGLHVYFALSEDVPEDEWSQVASALGRTAKLHGLLADAACTTDSARVLRPVGALHGNGNRVRVLKSYDKTYSLAELRSLLSVDDGEQFSLRDAPRRSRLNANEGLGLWESTPSAAVKIAAKCGALREIAAVKGDKKEPYWRAMVGLLKHCVEGIDLVHDWSSGHPEYDPDKTEAKLEGWHGGPTTCVTFSGLSKACDSCEYKGKITSPIVLGRMNDREVEQLPEDKKPAPPPAATVPDELPFSDVQVGDGFRITELNGRWIVAGKKLIESKDDEGNKITTAKWIPICDDVFWVDGWSEAGAEEGDGAAAVLHLYSNASKHVRRWPMPSKVISSQLKLFEWLSEHQITRSEVDVTVSNLMHNYVNSQFNIAKTQLAQFALRTRFGVMYDSDSPNARMVVAHGRYLIRGDGTIEDTVLGQDLVPHRGSFVIRPLPVSPTGRWARDVWNTHILPGAMQQVSFYRKYYERPGYEAAQLALMLMLASPFMVFASDSPYVPGGQLPQVGLTISLYSSQSGKGKTSLQRAAAAAYGDPTRLVIEGSDQASTYIYKSGLAAIHGTMPYFLDEVTQNSPADTMRLINMLAQGNDKHRAVRTGRLQGSRTWALIGSLSSNIPQRELLAAAQPGSDAIQMRLMEVLCDFPDLKQSEHTLYERDRDTLLAPNYGCVGAMLGFAIATLGPDRMRGVVKNAFDEASRLIPGSTQRERFFQRGMACVLACHDVLQRVKLPLFSRDVLIDQYHKVVGAADAYVKFVRRTPEDNLRKLISDLSPHTIVTGGDGTAGKAETVRNGSHVRPPIQGRYVVSQGTIFLLASSVHDWAMKNQCSAADLLKYARENGFMRGVSGSVAGSPGRYTLTRGTEISTVHGSVYAFDEERLIGGRSVPVGEVVPLRMLSAPDKSA